MKARIVLGLALAATLSGGCATTSTMGAAEHRAKRADAAYVAAVEAVARRRGVQVHWVNPPREEDRPISKR